MKRWQVGLITVWMLVWFVGFGYGAGAVEVDVCLGPDGQFLPWVVADEQGGVAVVWEDYRTRKDWDVYAQLLSPNGMKLWEGDGMPLCVERGNQRYLRMARSRDRFVVAWNDKRTGNWEIYAQAFDGTGEVLWQENGVPVCVHPAEQSTIACLSDGTGGAVIAWEDGRRDSAARDLYIQRVDATGQPMWERNGIPVLPSDSLQSDPQLIGDLEDGFYVVWWNVIGYERWRIMVYRIGFDGKPFWREPVVVSGEGSPSHNKTSTHNKLHGEPRVTGDGEGGIVVVWQIYENFINDNLYAQRIGRDGKKRWGERGVTICDASGIQKHASIAADGRGGLVVVWRDERDVYSDLYAQRLDPDGKPQWRANGVPICVAGGHQDKPSLVRWGNDRFFVAWVDFREDYGEESRNAIYGQAIDLEGNVLWEQAGVPICTAKGEQQPPFAIGTALDGLAVVWSDARRDLGDIYMWLYER